MQNIFRKNAKILLTNGCRTIIINKLRQADVLAVLIHPLQGFAGLAHPVERHLAKVEVASSSLVTRSNTPYPLRGYNLEA